jgi:hypothetical protein
MDASSPPDIYLFDDFRLDRRGGGLFRCAEAGGAVPVSLGSRALDVLRVLIERHGDLVAKDELMAAVWPNTAWRPEWMSSPCSVVMEPPCRPRPRWLAPTWRWASSRGEPATF